MRYRQPPKPEKREAMRNLLQQEVPIEEIAQRLGYKSCQSVITTMSKWGLSPYYSKSRTLTPARAKELADRLERRANQILADAAKFRAFSLQHGEAAPMPVDGGTQKRAAGVAPGQRE
jgi:hypothetical protein